jgi:hypothetical protein
MDRKLVTILTADIEVDLESIIKGDLEEVSKRLSGFSQLHGPGECIISGKQLYIPEKTTYQYWYNYDGITMKYHRLETDKEYNDRIEKEAKAQEKQRAKEIAQLKKLREKYKDLEI